MGTKLYSAVGQILSGFASLHQLLEFKSNNQYVTTLIQGV